MASPMQINARHGDESEAAHRSNRTIWIWAAIVAVALLVIIGLLAHAPSGPGANSGRVAADTANVKAGVAPGVASTYAGQPGGTTGGTPAPNPNAGSAPAQ
jgi:hypothetical protein